MPQEVAIFATSFFLCQPSLQQPFPTYTKNAREDQKKMAKKNKKKQRMIVIVTVIRYL